MWEEKKKKKSPIDSPVFFSEAAGTYYCKGKEVLHGIAMFLFLFHYVNITSLMLLLHLV